MSAVTGGDWSSHRI